MFNRRGRLDVKQSGKPVLYWNDEKSGGAAVPSPGRRANCIRSRDDGTRIRTLFKHSADQRKTPSLGAVMAGADFVQENENT